MNHLRVIFFLLLTSVVVHPQGEEEELFPDNELNIQVQDAPNTSIVFELVPIGANWAYYLTTDIFELYNYTTTNVSTITVGSSGSVDCNYNGYEYRFYDEGNTSDVYGCAQSSAGLKPIRNGFYRMDIKENGILKTYIYLDWRDNGFPDGSFRTCSGGNDMVIRYDKNDNDIMFWNSSGISSSNQTPDSRLIKGEIVNWADLNCLPRSTNALENYWPNALVMTNNGSNNPRIVWGPYPSTGITVNNFKIYRKYGTSTWQLFTTVSSSTYGYTDSSVSISGQQAGTNVQYKVTAVYNTSSETSATNVVAVNAQGGEIEKRNAKNNNSTASYNLAQNYPNPFNPTTIISYQLEESGYVLLKIYDILGKEVATLVNNVQEAGAYNVPFDASYLPAGIYIYSLRVNDFIKNQKMSFLK